MTTATSSALRERLTLLGVPLQERPPEWQVEFCQPGSWALRCCDYSDRVERALETVLDVVQAPRRDDLTEDSAARRIATVAVAHRYAEIDGGPERVFASENQDLAARVALARWTEELLDAYGRATEDAVRDRIAQGVDRIATEGGLHAEIERALLVLADSVRNAKI